MQGDANNNKTAKALSLSPSALSKYVQCPRQYYYAERLKLKNSQPTAKQVIGILTHQLLEWRNRQKKSDQKTTPEIFIEAIELLGKQNQSNAILNTIETALFDKLLRIQKAQVKHYLKLAFENYFSVLPQTVDALPVIETESWLRFSPEAFHQNVALTGRLDMLGKLSEDRLLLVDYKTNKSGFKDNAEKNQRQLEKSISIEPNWEEALLSKQLGSRDLQLPFYWWLLKNKPEFKPLKIDVALQFVRPHYQGGAQLLTISDEFLTEQHAMFSKIVVDTVIPAILNDTSFKPLGSGNTCRFCDFNSICEKGYANTQAEEDDFAAEDEAA